jgi:hypothetical protein
VTTFLSKALQAPEPFFRLGLQRLEAANGHPSTDIRFSTEVARAAKDKLRQLGLDPEDTTPEELYHMLQERIKADDQRLTRTLQTAAATHVSAEADVVAGMVHTLRQLPGSKRCFALRASSLKTMMKKVPPKKAMKQLGYRSLDSFIKHETPVSLLAAASLAEDRHWCKRFEAEYKRLQPGDFEQRSITIVQLSSKRWQVLATQIANEQKHNLLCFKELGAIVFLPLPADAPAGTTTASLSLALHELNQIRASSTFLKLCQVRADFGKIVQTVAANEPNLSSQLLDQDVPWHLIHRYYAKLVDHEQTITFEPHLETEDLTWHSIEKTLRAIEPKLAFWHHSAHLALLDGDRPVSLNIIDAALNYCNQLPFEQRLTHYFQHSLWHELLLRYLRPDTVEQAVLHELQPQLAEETVTV